MNRYFCDRCKKEAKKPKEFEEKIFCGSGIPLTFDLCGSCYLDFKQFLRGVKE